MNKYVFLFAFLIFALGCRETYCPNVSLGLAESKTLCTNCQSPNIHQVDPDKLLITYIQSDTNGMDHLIMRTLKSSKLSEPMIIASGNNWFVNWADIPSIVSLNTSGSKLMAHWLQMSAEGTYDYDVTCSVSNDGGSSWGDSFVFHDDKVAAEHGFVTMISDAKGAFVTWLDGRNTKTPISNQEVEEKNNHDHGHGHSGNMPMTLRAAWVDNEGKKYNDFEIDNKVCDCCQTDAVMTSSGPVVVYRDRSDEEIRDISVARYTGEKWTHKTLHKDNWKIAGCPVNGPAAAYREGLLVVTWYTQLNDQSKIFLALSRNDGATFESPILIAEGEVLGRVDVVIIDENLVVTWMESKEDKTFINSRIYPNYTSIIYEPQQLISTQNERRVGFPIVESTDHGVFMVRTKVENEELSVVLESFDGP